MASSVWMTSLILAVSVMWPGAARSQACDVDPPIAGINYTMTLTVRQAPIVVLGRVSRYPASPFSGGHQFNFQVYCVIKNGGYTIPRLLYLGVSVCHGTSMTRDRVYVVALESSPREPWYFNTYAPAELMPGAFRADDDKIAELYAIEGPDMEYRQPVGRRVGPAESCESQCPAWITLERQWCVKEPFIADSSAPGSHVSAWMCVLLGAIWLAI